jgi:hypothetical protein
MKIVLESKDSIDKTVYAEVTEEGMKDFLAWFVAFRYATQHGIHLTAFGVSTQGAFFLQSPFIGDDSPATIGG